MATTDSQYGDDFQLLDAVSVQYPCERKSELWNMHIEEYVTYEIDGQRHLQMQYYEMDTNDGLRTPCQFFDLADYEIERDGQTVEITYFTIPQNLTVRKRTYQEDGMWYYETATDEGGAMEVVDRTPMRTMAVAFDDAPVSKGRILSGYDDE